MPANDVLIVGNMLSAAGLPRAPSEELSERLLQFGYRVATVSSYRNRVLRLCDMLHTVWKRRRSYDVALVDVFSGASFVWAEAVAGLLRRLGKPYILTLHGGNLPEFAARSPERVRRLLRSAEITTAPSDYLKLALSHFRSDIVKLPNAIDCNKYPYRQRNQPQPQLVWLRAFHNIYQPTLAPKVLKELVGDFPECRLVMIGKDKGDGSLSETVKIAEQLGVRDRCEFRPAVPKEDVPSALASGDIFLNTATIDNTPVTVVEAAASGLCIVSTNVGGIPHLLAHKCNALLVPPNDERSMSLAVREILTQPGLAATLSANARQLAQQFDWPSILEQWKALIDSCSQRRSHN